MQPRNLAPDAAAGAELADALLDVLDDGALDELEPHAAITRLAAAVAATVINAVCFTVSSTGPVAECPGITGLPP
jgi:hypothetical protein